MPITQLQRDVTRSIRQYGKRIKGEVRFESGKGNGEWVAIRIRPIPNKDFRAPLEWPDVFPLEDRIKALKIIYGEDCKFAENGSAGNIDQHSMAMSARQWVIFFRDTPFAVPTTNQETSHV